MRIRFASIDHAKRVSKSLRSHFPDLKLATAHEWTARMTGYRDFHEMQKWHREPGPPSPRDHECSKGERLGRFLAQVAALAECAGIDRDAAEAIVLSIAPSGTHFPESELTRSIDRMGRFTPPLAAFSDAITAQDFARAAQFAPLLSASSRSHPIAEFDMALWQEAVATGKAPANKPFLDLLRAYADAGQLMCAYNYANFVQEQRAPADWAHQAKHYYERVINEATDPAQVAAAIVNYTPLVRDGELTGKPDWPAAVELYERAGAMGMIVGTFNAANVSGWLGDKGHAGYAERSAALCRKVITQGESGAPNLDAKLGPPIEQTVLSAKLNLIALDIDERYAGASLDAGIALAKSILGQDDIALDSYEKGIYKRLSRLTPPKGNSAGGNWRLVLQALGWSFDGKIVPYTHFVDRHRIELDMLQVQRPSGGRLDLAVVDDPCIPDQGGLELLVRVAMDLSQAPNRRVLVVGRKAFFQMYGDRCHTLAIYAGPEVEGPAHPVSLAYSTHDPDQLIERAKAGVKFGERAEHGAPSCFIPIAVNLLDERPKPWKAAFVSTCRYVHAGEGWCMPYASVESLGAIGGRVSGNRVIWS